MPCIKELVTRDLSQMLDKQQKESYPVVLNIKSKTAEEPQTLVRATEDPKGTIDTNLVGESSSLYSRIL